MRAGSGQRGVEPSSGLDPLGAKEVSSYPAGVSLLGPVEGRGWAWSRTAHKRIFLTSPVRGLAAPAVEWGHTPHSAART